MSLTHYLSLTIIYLTELGTFVLWILRSLLNLQINFIFIRYPMGVSSVENELQIKVGECCNQQMREQKNFGCPISIVIKQILRKIQKYTM